MLILSRQVDIRSGVGLTLQDWQQALRGALRFQVGIKHGVGLKVLNQPSLHGFNQPESY